MPRKKIEGAIKVCRKNPDALIRPVYLLVQLCSTSGLQRKKHINMVTCRRNQYSGEDEFCVETRESGSREQEVGNEEKRVSTAKDTTHATYMSSMLYILHNLYPHVPFT